VAQKNKTPLDYQRAFLWYRQHLKWFAKSDRAKELNFLYAELLFEAGQYESAAKEYEKTAYQYVRQGKDAEAGYAALLAYAEQEKQAEGKEKSVWSRVIVGSAMRFGRTFPDDPRAAGVVTKAAQEMFALKKYDQAATAARQILELSTKTTPTMRRTAWKIIARAEFEKGDYTRAEVAYKVALSLTKEGEEDYKTLKEGLAASVYKQGEFMRAKGNTEAAISQFARVGEVAPGSSITQAASFDIAASLMGDGKWAAAVSKFKRFREENPEHPLAERVSENLIKAYLETKQYALAAEELETLSGFKQDPAIKRDILLQQAELYEKSNNTPQVIATYRRYVETYPLPLEPAMEARQALAELFTKAGRQSDRRYWLQEMVRAEQAAKNDSTDRSRYLAAKAAYELAQPKLQAFQQVKLVEPLKQNLKEKKQRLQVAIDAYSQAADYGIAEVTTASVYWLGELYGEFARALMESERPAGLSAEELEQYNILLEEQAFPFEEKAIDIHESNVGRIGEGMYDEWVRKSLEKLKALNPFRYAKAEKAEAVAGRIY
jgi:tetratricopeptide (TPR) repeat protein